MEATMATEIKVHEGPNWLTVTTPYNTDYVEALKSRIPYHAHRLVQREWDAEKKVWYVRPIHRETLYEILRESFGFEPGPTQDPSQFEEVSQVEILRMWCRHHRAENSALQKKLVEVLQEDEVGKLRAEVARMRELNAGLAESMRDAARRARRTGTAHAEERRELRAEIERLRDQLGQQNASTTPPESEGQDEITELVEHLVPRLHGRFSNLELD
jgi:HAMP domain-containing protein